MTTVCAFIAQHLPEGLWSSGAGGEPPARFLWLVPVLADEADLVRRSGFEKLEQLLEAGEVDLYEPTRASALG